MTSMTLDLVEQSPPPELLLLVGTAPLDLSGSFVVGRVYARSQPRMYDDRAYHDPTCFVENESDQQGWNVLSGQSEGLSSQGYKHHAQRTPPALDDALPERGDGADAAADDLAEGRFVGGRREDAIR